ncbi:prickle-like protein 1 [Xenopus laevis]|uniref:Prickle-like protein 1 n=2 Tax=Xenopus laevis TaxID=8355 RepID=A0A1L8H6V3_XENLA|nr:prickle-like protein 1 [Xenopus laevis]OCT91834.1 hypothetical protein XELAEV_18014890mg [Xenopus laevis]
MAPESVSPAITSQSTARTASSSDSDSGCAIEDFSELEVPANLTLAASGVRELKIIRTLLHLLPPQDWDERFCTALGEHERSELQKLIAQRRLHSMRHGVIVPVTQETPDTLCVRCHCQIAVGDTAVQSEKVQEKGLHWHLGCFVCETCRLPLLQFIYFLQDGRIYCGRHHAELSRSRCAACDQLILSEKCIVAEGHCWHMEHFCCWECDEVLGGRRYVMKGGRPFCKGCFLHLYAESCEACREPVDPDGDIVAFRGQYWHALPSCFCCTRCRTSLKGSRFTVVDNQIYCSSCATGEIQILNNHTCFTKSRTKTSSQQYNLQWGSSHYQHGHQGYTTTVAINISMKDSCSITDCHGGCSALCRDMTNNEPLPQLHEPHDATEDDTISYSSTSTSSDSEPEGFFLGTPIPNYSLSRQSPSPVCSKNSSLKRRQISKNCKVS